MKQHEKLRQSWIWNKTVEEYVLNTIAQEKELKSNKELSILNIPCGKSKIGTVRADIDKIHNPDIVCNWKNLPFETNTFNIVIQDPIWKIGYYYRFKPFYEVVRVCKVGGLIIYNAYWIPHTKFPDLLKMEDIVVRQDSPFTNTSIIVVLRKLKNCTV